MRIDIISANNYRINEYIADMLYIALRGYGDLSRELRDEQDIILMTNGLGLTEEARRAIEQDKVNVLYFYDELQSSVVPKDNVIVLSQFKDLGQWDLPVARLSIFDPRFDNIPIVDKAYEFVYWGHKKPNREHIYKALPDNGKSLYIGEWEDKTKSAHAPYIRDMDALYTLIAKGKRTIVNGSKFDDYRNSIPLRVYEALMNGVIPDTIEHRFGSYEDSYNYYIKDLSSARSKLKDKIINFIKEYS